MGISIRRIKQYEKYSLEFLVEAPGKDTSFRLRVLLDYPAVLTDRKGAVKKLRYEECEGSGKEYYGRAEAEDLYGNRYRITDVWRIEGNYCTLERKAECIRFKKVTGIRLTTEFRCRGEQEKSFKDYQFLIPGAFYNKNDTDGDGIEDYLGTYVQDYKDDRNPSLSVTSYAQKSGCFLSLIRAVKPRRDQTITREQINARHFLHDTDIGSLGISPSKCHAGEYILRCDYPFYERNSFCLNVDGSGWSAYREIKEGSVFEMSYLLYGGEAHSLTEASWSTTAFQMDRMLDADVKLHFSLEKARQYRRRMIHESFREFPEKKGNPAGYFVHFSPRQRYGKQNILEYGFCGAQTLLAYDMLSAAWEEEEARPGMAGEYRKRALKTLDYFVNSCIEESGFPNGIYHVDKEKTVYWWTGILLPFQYSSDRQELEKYLGSQITDSLMKIAGELKKTEGNYCRSMTDTMYYLMKSYLLEKEKGCVHEEWFSAVVDFCDRLLLVQNTNGSWNRGYAMDGEPLKSPPQWFGSSEMEQGSGAIFPIPLLVEVYQYTKQEKYLVSAKKAAEFIRENYIKNGVYIGGINDTSHKKSVKIDAAAAMFVMRSMLLLYEQDKEEKYLQDACDTARILASWVYLWDIPFDRKTLLGRHGFKTTGWAGCDVIPAGSYVDCSFQEVVPELLRIAGYCGDGRLAKLAKAVTRGMQQGLSSSEDMYGYAMEGVQCEGYMTSLWLADTKYSEFSGAASKNKGDDNDTCNGFVNGMALLNLDYLKEKYGSLENEKIFSI